MPAWLLLGLGLALAQEPVAIEEEADDDEFVIIDRSPPEVIIVEDGGLRKARQAVIEGAKRAGYVREIRKDGRTLMRHDDPWKGDIVIYDDGRVTVKRQPVRFEPPTGKKRPQDYLWCVIVPLCIKPSGQTASPKIFRAREREALAAVAEQVTAWRERISDSAIDQKVDALPEKLARLWNEGVPLEDGPRLETWEARRRAIFAYWDSRTETDWGERVRDAVEAFVRGEVQASDHPYSQAEIDVLNGQRTVLRVFLPTRRTP